GVFLRLLQLLLNEGLRVEVEGELEIITIDRRVFVTGGAWDSDATSDVQGLGAIDPLQSAVLGELQTELALIIGADLADEVLGHRSIGVLADVLAFGSDLRAFFGDLMRH